MAKGLEHTTMATVLVGLALVAGALAGHGQLLAAGEASLLRDCAEMAAASPLVPDPVMLEERSFHKPPPPPRPKLDPMRLVTEPLRRASPAPTPLQRLRLPPGIVRGTPADIAVQRACDFMAANGCGAEADRVRQLIAIGEVHVGEIPPGREGVAVPERFVSCAESDDKLPEQCFARTVSLARTLVFAVNRLPRDGDETRGQVPGVVDAWTRTLAVLALWVKDNTHALSELHGKDTECPTRRALAVVEEMRSALADYRALAWCHDGRGEEWESLDESLNRARTTLRGRLDLDVSESLAM